MSTVNIRVSPETRDALTAIGGKGETYDAILVRLLAHYARIKPIVLSKDVLDIPDIEKEAEG